jgi:hypothetical protein
MKNQELTRFPYMQVASDIPLEISRKQPQLGFRPHRNQRFSRKVMGPQSCKSPNCVNSGTPTWESRDKKPFGCGPHGGTQSILIGGRWWLPPSLGGGESYESEFAHGSSWHQKCSNYALTNLLFGLCKSM